MSGQMLERCVVLASSRGHSFSSCFISAPAGMNLGLLPEILGARGIGWEWAKASTSELANPYAAIRHADFFIGVLNGTRADYRVIHEVGVAAALAKPVLLIMSPLRKLPVDLRQFTIAHVKLTDERALRFHIDAFLSAPHRNVFEERSPTSSSAPEPPSIPATQRARPATPDSRLEQEVFDLIQQAGGSAVVQPESAAPERYRPDLLVWLSSQEPELLDPAVIEVKGRVERGSIRSIEERLLGFMGTSGVRTGLVITSETVPERSQPAWPTIFWLDLQTFRDLLQSSRLGSYLRESRNRAVHGVR
ncbi:nucleoside 2-deoxyribosyltransferase [Ketogulonicigenium vulgare]|uniref:nucleoside 2-deoxyribosyltransferase n=1 Tax=Ketogulonicigenium vulgare TaxID=92945 RepID=UPI0008111E87|nr:nucleoside 2-deoxyribosyltransferase [Ketogulonicigenium vulgare]ANW33560.1 hypothetical protein KvSKV_05990 [Ketogulonicigenium vulgare]